ncbi:hypothetical protein NPX13_g4947 [Xylaria arbuscula]|uniref:F-box domain-containing protein n=1 Tax=Xylaria arbuscula TaxID=114810 RepID=A0A9W8NFS9_9PEZI|nr:hypothetical protein NPX13_g4947 [Xylaria arbuscula]
MSTPLSKWQRGQVLPIQPAPIQNLPLELALEIADALEAPEDIINFALACPGFLAYWIHLTEIIQQRRLYQEDPESNPPLQLPPIQDGPLIYDPARIALFQGYSQRTVRRLFSDEIQRLIMLILFMPNPSNKIYDIEWRQEFPQVADLEPYSLLAYRRAERFDMYYKGPEYGEMLFTFKNINRISPYSTAIHNFATDFVKKALSYDHDVAHHCFPASAHPSLVCDDPLSQRATAARDRSPIQSLDQLHETERERIMLAFYQYEAMCATSAKVTGYWEIRRACDVMVGGQRRGINGWNFDRARQSPLAGQSMCQIERVVSVYHYVRLQYLLMFDALLAEYKELLYESEWQFRFSSRGIRTRTWRDHIAPMFGNAEAKLEWVDVMCSKGLLFLPEVLNMDIDRRRHDELDNASGQNLAWVEYNYQFPDLVLDTDFLDERPNSLRRRGYVFWNRERLQELYLDRKVGLLHYISYEPDTVFSFTQALDSVAKLAMTVDIENKETITDAAWRRAGLVFKTPSEIQLLVEFGVLGETWRIAEEADERGRPILCRVH